MDEAIKFIRSRPGLRYKITEWLGLSSGAVYKWHEVPRQYVPDVARLAEVPAQSLMPDVFPDAPPLPASSDNPKGAAG